jgi:hypothetical protein
MYKSKKESGQKLEVITVMRVDGTTVLGIPNLIDNYSVTGSMTFCAVTGLRALVRLTLQRQVLWLQSNYLVCSSNTMILSRI